LAAQTGAAAHPELPALERVLGRADLVLFTVCAILTIDTLASSAAMGFAWFSWWAITMTVFFIPYGLITAELGAAWPGEGGVYIWVREAFGPKWGSTAAWLYWINNATWIPSVYLIFAGTFGQMFLKTNRPGRTPDRDRPDLGDGRRDRRLSLRSGCPTSARWSRPHLPRARRLGSRRFSRRPRPPVLGVGFSRGGTTPSRTFRPSSTRPSASSS
jgi:amino acid transporter